MVSRIYLGYICEPYLLKIVDKCRKRIAQEATVMVLTFYYKTTIVAVCANRIYMVGKKVDELFGSAAK